MQEAGVRVHARKLPAIEIEDLDGVIASTTKISLIGIHKEEKANLHCKHREMLMRTSRAQGLVGSSDGLQGFVHTDIP